MPREDVVARRNLRLGALGLGVAGSYFGYLLQRAFLGEESGRETLKATRARAARRVREELGSLRGPAMKIGQALSLETLRLPEEVLAELSQLQMTAPGMHPSLVRVQFKSSLGRYPEEVFREFDPQPFAAASLGQVHRATTHDGHEVAVKVQYPGIRRAVENDFQLLRTLARPARFSGHVPPAALDELEREILAETDYGREASNIDHFQGHLGPLGFVKVPRVDRRYSTDRVLTMSLVPGQPLGRFLDGKASQALRDKVGTRLFELFFFQLLRMNALHADPHWGNYLIGEEGEIGLVDFGCVKYLQPEFVAALSAMFLYPGRRDGDHFQELLTQWYRVCNERLRPQARRALTRFCERFYGRVYPPHAGGADEPVDFGNAALLRGFRDETELLVRGKVLLTPYLFVVRAEAGLYNTLHKLRARVRTSHVVRKYLRGDSGGPYPPPSGLER